MQAMLPGGFHQFNNPDSITYISCVSVEYNSYAEYLNTWQEAIEAKTFPIHVMYFEDLKKVNIRVFCCDFMI